MIQFRQVSAGFFKEAKKVGNEKQVLSYLLLLSILSAVSFSGLLSYVCTFITLVLQFIYIVKTKKFKRLSLKARNVHRLELLNPLLKNDEFKKELSNYYTELRKATISWINSEGNNIKSSFYSSPPQINLLNKLAWKVTENCFWNKNLFNQQLKSDLISVVFMALACITAIFLWPVFNSKGIAELNTYLNLDIAQQYNWLLDNYINLVKMVLVFMSSFLVIEKVENCIELYYGREKMIGMYDKLLNINFQRISEGVLMDIVSDYYMVLNSTPNISDRIYQNNSEMINTSWELLKNGICIPSPKNEITQTLVFWKSLLPKNVHWCIIGSTSLFLQDEKIYPSDIDILISDDSIGIINEYYENYIVKPIEYTESSYIKSYYGKMIINNINIDIVASISNKIESKWLDMAPLHQHLELHKVSSNLDVFVRNKEYEKGIYAILNTLNKINSREYSIC